MLDSSSCSPPRLPCLHLVPMSPSDSGSMALYTSPGTSTNSSSPSLLKNLGLRRPRNTRPHLSTLGSPNLSAASELNVVEPKPLTYLINLGTITPHYVGLDHPKEQKHQLHTNLKTTLYPDISTGRLTMTLLLSVNTGMREARDHKMPEVLPTARTNFTNARFGIEIAKENPLCRRGLFGYATIDTARLLHREIPV